MIILYQNHLKCQINERLHDNKFQNGLQLQNSTEILLSVSFIQEHDKLLLECFMDLEEDIKNGHYSYPTLGFEEELSTRSPSELATLIRSDVKHLKRLQFICMGLINSSRNRCIKLGADLMEFFVHMLDARLDAFFSEMLKGQQ